MKDKFYIPNIDFLKDGYWVIINDFNYFVKIQKEVDEWLESIEGGSITGMIIKFANEEDRLFFLLKWDNGD